MSQYILEILIKAIDEASDELKNTGDGLDLVGDRAKSAGKALLGMSAAGTALIVSSTLTAARTEELGGVLQVVAGNAGYSSEQIASYEQSVRAMGITTGSTRQALTQMAQANIDYAHAADLARLAQDAAVVAQLDSSEAFERLITVVQRGEVEMARTMGLTVDFQGAYERLSEELGISVDALTDQQRVQARVSEVMDQGASIAGTYEGAMDSAGKRMRSMSRHVEEAKNSLGEAFLPVMGQAVDAATNLLKAFNDLTPEQKQFTANTLAIGTVVMGTGGAMLLAAPKIAALGTALTGTTVAASAVLIPMAAVVLAVVAVTAAIKLYADIQAHETDVGNAWTQMLNEQVAAGKSATEVVNAYTDAQQAVAAAHDEGGILADIFVDKQAAMTASYEDLTGSILESSISYEDYLYATDAVNASTQEQNDSIMLMHGSLNAARFGYIELTPAMTEAGWALEKSGGTFIDTSLSATHFSDVMLDAEIAAGMAGDELEKLSTAASTVAGSFGEMEFDNESLWQMALASGASIEALTDLAEHLGIASSAEIEATLSAFALAEELGADLITAEQYAERMGEVANQEMAAGVAASEAAGEMDPLSSRMIEGRDAALELADGAGTATAQLGGVEAAARRAQAALAQIERNIDIAISISEGGARDTGKGAQEFQHGLDYVPYDEFPAILHKGERVLTASENKQFNDNRNFGGNQTTYNVYNPMAAAILAAQQQDSAMGRLEAGM